MEQLLFRGRQPKDDRSPNSARQDMYAARTEALRARVGAAAKALAERGIRPTVTRIRAALGGGSPNELAPALKHWKESVLPRLGDPFRGGGPEASLATVPPPQIADLTHELWQRALAAAAVELKGGPTARQIAMRTEEAHSLRNQLTGLRDQLQRESLAYGELRAQAARHEAIARQALTRAGDAETRERDLLRELGEVRQRVLQLEATVTAQPSPKRAATSRPGRRRRPRSSADLSKTPGAKKPQLKQASTRKPLKVSRMRASPARKTKPSRTKRKRQHQ